MALTPDTPDWWLDRLYKKLRDRTPKIRTWDDWYTGAHPVPQGYEGATPVLLRLLDTLGLNMLAVVTDAVGPRMKIEGFKVNGTVNGDIWEIWQDNNFDRGSRLVRQEKMALSESYVLVDPNSGKPLLTAEHPEQCIVENAPGSNRARAAGLKVWQDDLDPTGPKVRAMVYLPDQVVAYAAPTRIYSADTLENRSMLALRPQWERQDGESGPHDLGEVPLVPFPNRPRMLRAPVPEFFRAIPVQQRINKTLMDRMAMQDAGAFKAKWATGVDTEDTEFQVALHRMFTAENSDAKFGQFQAEDIRMMLEAVRDDVSDCATLVPTSPDHILGKLVNVSGDGLKLAHFSEVGRAQDRMGEEDDSWEDVNRLALKGAGKSVPNVGRMTTEWRNPEYRTDTERANAGALALASGMPRPAVWERYYNASPDEVTEWAKTPLPPTAPAPGMA